VCSRHLVYPLFIEDTDSGAVPIASMPGCLRHSRQSLVKEVKEAFR
jgi:delta-aminolevulinic acid dehydratase/porphobilinogen synthase